MNGKSALEEEVKVMKKHFGGLVALVKELKTKVENLEKKKEPNENLEISEIVEKQRLLNEPVVANSENIKRIDSKIRDMRKATLQ
jgi:arsenate reductase-like glutaredoxin family protein